MPSPSALETVLLRMLMLSEFLTDIARAIWEEVASTPSLYGELAHSSVLAVGSAIVLPLMVRLVTPLRLMAPLPLAEPVNVLFVIDRLVVLRFTIEALVNAKPRSWCCWQLSGCRL